MRRLSSVRVSLSFAVITVNLSCGSSNAPFFDQHHGVLTGTGGDAGQGTGANAGSSSGGTSTGGTSSGGSGATATGGTSTGGSETGGASTGGTASGTFCASPVRANGTDPML